MLRIMMLLISFAMMRCLPQIISEATSLGVAVIIRETISFAEGKHHSKRPHLSGRQMWSFCWRRVRDSNPRFLSESLVFKTSSLNRSDNSPCPANHTIGREKCQGNYLRFLPGADFCLVWGLTDFVCGLADFPWGFAAFAGGLGGSL